jgi:hypothetical protein
MVFIICWFCSRLMVVLLCPKLWFSGELVLRLLILKVVALQS